MLRSREIFFSTVFFTWINSSTLSERLVTPLFRLIEKLLLLCWDGIVWAVREFFGNSFHLITLGLPFFILSIFIVDFDHCWGTWFYYGNERMDGKNVSIHWVKWGFCRSHSIIMCVKNMNITQVNSCGNFYSNVIAWLLQMICFIQ